MNGPRTPRSWLPPAPPLKTQPRAGIRTGASAATALRTTRFMASRLKLEALDEGLTNVTRDESRYMSFGLRAAEEGVTRGFGKVIEDAHFDVVAAAARVLIGPSRHNPIPAIRPALLTRATQLSGGVGIARDRLAKQLRLVGLAYACDRMVRAWDQGIEKALDSYAD